MIVRPVAPGDVAAWARMRAALWPDEDAAELAREAAAMDMAAFVAEAPGGGLIGFIELAVRNYAEGAPPGPAAYVEGVWVEPQSRRRGVARHLLAAAEQWGRDRGLAHLGSDALIDNAASHAWHRAAGFAEVERLVVFGKPIS
jgi:aminoglycoside 6'-N-acetyltransferase I